MWARKARGEPDLLDSTRWIEGYEGIAEMAAQLPTTRLVHVADREADIGALLARAQVLGEIAFALAPGRGRKARTVTQRVWVVRSLVRLPGNQTTMLTVVEAHPLSDAPWQAVP